MWRFSKVARQNWGTKMSDETTKLDALFAEARGDAPKVPDPLMTRVLADAASVSAAEQAPTPQPAPARKGRILGWFGGWAGVAGLSTAAAAGVFIGFAAPQGVNSVAAAVSPATSSIYGLTAVSAFSSDFDDWSLDDG